MDGWMNEPNQQCSLRAPILVLYWHPSLLLPKFAMDMRVLFYFQLRNITPSSCYYVWRNCFPRWWAVCFFFPLVYLTWPLHSLLEMLPVSFPSLALICITSKWRKARNWFKSSALTCCLFTRLPEITGCFSMQFSANRHLNYRSLCLCNCKALSQKNKELTLFIYSTPSKMSEAELQLTSFWLKIWVLTLGTGYDRHPQVILPVAPSA